MVSFKFLDLDSLSHVKFRVKIHEVKHDLSVYGIKLGSKSFNKLLTNLFLRKGISVASLGRHGIISIRYSNDTCKSRDIFTLKALRITLSVISFMMIIGRKTKIR